MTSLLPEVESNVSRLKRESQSHTVAMGLKLWRSGTTHEESRSFLELSRENLSSQQQQQQSNGAEASPNCAADTFSAELLQQHSPSSSSSSSSLMLVGRRLRWLGLLSWAALGLALACAIFELWALRRILAHASDIASLGRDVDALKQRLLERDLLDELRAFEQQLYSSDAGEGDGSETSEEADRDSEQQLDTGSVDEYELGYEDETIPPSSTSPNSADPAHQEALSATTTTTTTEGASSPCSTSELEKVLATLRRLAAERGALTRSREAGESELEDSGSWTGSQRLLESERKRGVSEEHGGVRRDVVPLSTLVDGDDEAGMQRRDGRSIVHPGLFLQRPEHSPKTG